MSEYPQSRAKTHESAELKISNLPGFRPDGGSSLVAGICSQLEKTGYDDSVFINVQVRSGDLDEGNEVLQKVARNNESCQPISDNVGEENQLYLSVASSEKIPITCKNNHAFLFKNKLGSGKRGKCIEFEGEWLTPSEFENLSGLEMSKDWKRSLRYGGRSMQTLINKGLLRPHAATCMCSVCCDDDTVAGPIRFFTPKIRRKRCTTASLPSTPYGVTGDRCHHGTADHNHGPNYTFSQTNLIPVNTVGCNMPEGPENSSCEFAMFSSHPRNSRIKQVLDALSEVEEKDSEAWGDLESKARSIAESLTQLQEGIERTKKQCKDRRQSLVQNILSILDQETCFVSNEYESGTVRPYEIQKTYKVDEKFDEEPPDEDGNEICRACGRPANSECTGCRKATYCSTECQEKDWNAGHRDVCRNLAEEAVGTDILPI